MDTLSNVEVSKESDIRIVFGEYGHGKSQTANIIVEEIKSLSRDDLQIYLENITTLRNFYYNFSQKMQSYLSDSHKHLLAKVDKYLNQFQRAKEDNSLGHGRKKES